jgi:hypothetical protein
MTRAGGARVPIFPAQVTTLFTERRLRPITALVDGEQQTVPYRRIGAILVERGLITESQLAGALEEQRRSGRLLGEIFVSSYGVSRVALADALAVQWAEAQQHISLEAERPPPAATEHRETESPVGDAENELRLLLEEAEAARTELARRTDELGKRLAALEALVVGVSGALDELRVGGTADQDGDSPPAPAQRARVRFRRRSAVSRGSADEPGSARLGAPGPA